MLRFFFKLFFGIGFLAFFVISAVLCFYYVSLPNIETLGKDDSVMLRINFSNHELIANRSKIAQSEVRYYELPEHLIKAVIAIEDRKFFSHHGVDPLAIIRAFYVNHRANRVVQGGSTITQQLAKMLFLNSDKNIHRKIQEVMLALRLEHNFSKEQILMFYLNRAYFGSGSYGIGNAAYRYFGKNVADLNLQESALLAGLLKAPSKISPKNNRKLSNQRTKLVLNAMIDAGFLNEEKAIISDVELKFRNDHGHRYHFADYAQKQAEELLLGNQVKAKILNIATTLDEEIQKNLETKLEIFRQKNIKKLGGSEIAIVIMKKDGAVLAMSGGNDYQQSQFNRAILAKRQAGSAFKTFVYLAAFENGYKSDDIFEDKKFNIGNWLPDNFESRYLGQVSLRQAFAYSLNSVAAQLSQKVGGGKIAKTAQLCGILSPINRNDLTIALGTTEVSLFELTSAYATIANDGVPIMPYSITEISDQDEKLLFKRKSSGFDAVISKEGIAAIKDSLRQVVAVGTGKKANLNDKIHGKTGTSQDFRDAWFIGFDDQKVIGVWIGNDDNSPTNKISGGSLPAELFAEIYQQ